MIYQIVAQYFSDSGITLFSNVIYEGEDINEAIHAENEFADKMYEEEKKFTTIWFAKDTKCNVRRNTWIQLLWAGIGHD